MLEALETLFAYRLARTVAGGPAEMDGSCPLPQKMQDLPMLQKVVRPLGKIKLCVYLAL